MKFYLSLLCAVALGSSLVSAAEERPSLPLETAVAIAAKYLKDNGKDKDHWIASITYDRQSMTNGTYHWYVKWSPSMDIGGRRELGLEIAMDGSIARAVDRKK